MNSNTQTPFPTRKRPKWLYWLAGIGIALVVIICSCVSILYYIGSRMTPEERASLYATSTARAEERASIRATSTTDANASEPTQIVQLATANAPASNTAISNLTETSTIQITLLPSPSVVPATNTASPISETSTPIPTITPLPTNTPIPLKPTDPPLANIPVMEGLSLRTARIYKSELGDDWPLSVDTGTLGCDGHNGVGAIIFALDDGTTYALNGIAKGRTYLAGRRIYLDIDPIWLPHPTIEGLKKDISPLIRRGQELCQ